MELNGYPATGRQHNIQAGRMKILAALLWLSLLVAGCASHLPALQDPTAVEQEQGRLLLERLSGNRTPQRIDLDLVLSWHGYGQSGKVNGELQATGEGEFRFAVPDPLGRPLFLFAATPARFILIDNQQGHVYTGPVWNSLVRKYIPDRISLPLIYALLVDQVPDQEPESIYRDKKATRAFWYVFGLPGQCVRMILADEDHLLPLRQIVIGPDKHVVLDLSYEGPAGSEAGRPLVPTRIQIAGDGLPASFQLTIHSWYPDPKFSRKIFHVQPPSSFTVENIQ